MGKHPIIGWHYLRAAKGIRPFMYKVVTKIWATAGINPIPTAKSGKSQYAELNKAFNQCSSNKLHSKAKKAKITHIDIKQVSSIALIVDESFHELYIMGENTQINNPKKAPHIAIREKIFQAFGISTNDRRNMPNKIPGNNKSKEFMPDTKFMDSFNLIGLLFTSSLYRCKKIN